ncbi:pyruvate phosphate dikinase [Roseobacter sp. SK209-2-6]|nr:pyruvate phosphate dikinase [Roseobacter sp. SK209-2-6]
MVFLHCGTFSVAPQHNQRASHRKGLAAAGLGKPVSNRARTQARVEIRVKACASSRAARGSALRRVSSHLNSTGLFQGRTAPERPLSK